MKHQLFESLINGTLELITQQKINRIKNNCKQQLELIANLSTIKEVNLNDSLNLIFQKLNGKSPESKKVFSNRIWMNFKLMSKEDKSVLASEIWELNWKQIGYNQKQFGKEDAREGIRDFITGVVSMSSMLPNWKGFIQSKTHKASNCYITSQVSFTNVVPSINYGTQKVQIQAYIPNRRLGCRVYYSFKPTPDSSPLKKQEGLIMKKQSITTMVTCISQGFPGFERKISIYSYYDAENEVTFLSNDDFSEQNNEEDVENLAEGQKIGEEDEYEMILEEEDLKVYRFNECLKEWGESGSLKKALQIE